MLLHYIHDPMCGWCYGASPLIRAAAALPNVNVALHAGGMMTGVHRQPVTPQLRDYVTTHDRRIAAMTGQPFGDAYFDGLLHDTGAVLDSEPPIAALLAVEALGGDALRMLGSIQSAHYVDGKRVAERDVLADLAASLGIERAAFIAEFERQCADGKVAAHIAESRHMLAELGGQGFPTVAAEQGEHLMKLDVGRYLGKPAAWTAMLEGLFAR